MMPPRLRPALNFVTALALLAPVVLSAPHAAAQSTDTAGKPPAPAAKPAAKPAEKASKPSAKSAGKADAKAGPKPDKDTFSGLAFRSIGPANVSGRIVDLAVDPRDKSVWYVATAYGGV